MNWLQQLSRWAADRRRWMAVGLLGVFLSVLTLTLSEALHRALHAEACSAQHQCAVTMLQSGQLETPVAVSVPVVLLRATRSLPTPPKTFAPSVDFDLPPSCGPPALF